MKTAYEFLKEKELMSREVIAAKCGDTVIGLSTEIGDCEVTPVTFESKEGSGSCKHGRRKPSSHHGQSG